MVVGAKHQSVANLGLGVNMLNERGCDMRHSMHREMRNVNKILSWNLESGCVENPYLSELYVASIIESIPLKADSYSAG
jgi:hypothetical protein